MSAHPVLAPAVADVLLELVNIGIGRAARGLSELTNREVGMSVPSIEVIDQLHHVQAADFCHGITLRISQSFSGGIEGQALLVLNRSGAVRLAELLLGKVTGDDALDDNEQSALLELGNIVIGNVMGLLANELDSPLEYDMPELQLRGMSSYVDLISDLVGAQSSHLLMMKASLSIKEDKISGYFILIFPSATLTRVITRLLSLAAP